MCRWRISAILVSLRKSRAAGACVGTAANLPMTKISEKISTALFGAVLAAALFLYLYLWHGYVFPFIEQNRMFLWDGDWVLRRMAECGGTAAVARDFVLQFFIEPWSGALITALLLAAVGVTMRRTLERVAADNGAWLLWLAPVAAQIFLTVDYDYRYEGLLSWLAAWGLFSIMVRVGGGTALRVAVATALSVVLYWLAGPAAIAFAVTLFVYEAMCGHKRWWYLLPVAAALAMALAAYGRGWYGTLARAFTPEAYWNPMVPASPWVWAAWVAMPVAVAVVRPLAALRHRAGTMLRRGAVVVVQVSAVAVITVAAAHGEILHAAGYEAVRTSGLSHAPRRVGRCDSDGGGKRRGRIRSTASCSIRRFWSAASLRRVPSPSRSAGLRALDRLERQQPLPFPAVERHVLCRG